MELKQLRNFLSVAQTGSFSKAAVILGVAQPMLSRQIKCLEEEMGVELVYRNGRGVVLTEAGRVLAQHADSILSSVSDASSRIKAMRATPCGEVVLGIPPMIGTVLTVPVVERFRENFPNVSLRIVEAFSGYVLEWLSTARLDVAVVYNVARTSVLVTEPLVEEDLCLVASTGVPAPVEGRSIRLDQLDRVPLILPNRSHGLRTLVNNFLAKIGAAPNVVMEVDGLSAIMRLVEHGTACTILSRSAVMRQVAEGRLRVWSIVQPRMYGQWLLATSTQRPVTPVTRSLARMIRSEVQTLIAAGHWAPHVETEEAA
jgi:LysR family nitrogen assimilation transcriptional regulator